MSEAEVDGVIVALHCLLAGANALASRRTNSCMLNAILNSCTEKRELIFGSDNIDLRKMEFAPAEQ